MSYKLRYLPMATEDLAQLGRYLLQFYPSTLKRVMNELEKALARLPENPELYEKYSEDLFFRKMPVDKYVVFYHVNEVLQTIDIYRILRASWNLPEYLTDLK